MNPRHVLLSLSLAFAAALGAPASGAASPAANATSPVALSVNQVTGENASVQRGDTPHMVQAALGMPYRRLSPDIHLFSGYHADLPGSDQPDCSVLMVTYTNGKVSDLKLVNRAALKVIAANLKNPASGALVAESK